MGSIGTLESGKSGFRPKFAWPWTIYLTSSLPWFPYIHSEDSMLWWEIKRCKMPGVAIWWVFFSPHIFIFSVNICYLHWTQWFGAWYKFLSKFLVYFFKKTYKLISSLLAFSKVCHLVLILFFLSDSPFANSWESGLDIIIWKLHPVKEKFSNNIMWSSEIRNPSASSRLKESFQL